MYRKVSNTVRLHPFAVDLSIALGLAVLLALIPVGGAERTGRPLSSAILPGFIAAIVALPLMLRRRYPYHSLAGIVLLTVLSYGLSSPKPPVMLPLALALYSVGARGYRRGSLISAGAVTAALAVVDMTLVDSAQLAEVMVRDAAWILGSTALGFAVASRRAYVDEFRRRALEAERTREEEAQRRVNEERLRIARDVHDGVAHALASISLQASAAGAVIETDPEGAREALRQIRGASVSALAELRATLGVLRQPGGPAATEDPALDRLARLADVLRAGGIEVSVDRRGQEDRSVPAEIGNVAYRVLQEALTNVLRHSGAKHADVIMAYDRSRLVISVADDGVGPQCGAGRGTGFGIRGMRERVEAVGGHLEAGVKPGGGFLVRADLPLAGTA